MIKRCNKRLVCKFYTLSGTTLTEPTIDSMGQITKQFSLHSKGIFSKEKPRLPKEVKEGDRSINEQESILFGTWTKTLSNVTHGMFCFIPSLSKVYAVQGNASDPMGDRKTIQITIVDNVTSDVSNELPGAPI
jgi:hypothetical protein